MRTKFRYLYLAMTSFIWLSVAATCYAPPRGQSSAEAFFPLLLSWVWLALIGSAGITVVILGKVLNRALLLLMCTIACGFVSVTFDYWIVGRLWGTDIANLQGPSELLNAMLFVLVLASCVGAPFALATALWTLRREAAKSGLRSSG